MSQIAAAGGQPQKPPKYAPIYQGSFFNGINTNRSPLRAASANHIYQKFYGDTSADALIAGSNVEVSNRLTLTRRPGNPIYDNTVGHTFNHIGAFDDFRVNKAQSDVFGTTLESIFTMIDEDGTGTNKLYSLTSDFKRGGDSGYFTGLDFTKASSAGQTFMQAVGNSLYFADGVDQKKWLQSLFQRTPAGNNTFLQGTDGLAGTYPFGTYLLDPATGNIQQFIGISIGAVTNVSISNNVITLTVNLTDDTHDYQIGTSFQLWGMTSHPYLNGATITLTAEYDHTVLGRKFVGEYQHANDSGTEAGPAYIIQTGTTPIIAETGNSVPTWGTTVPSSANDFMGSLTEDGNTVWINRGQPVYNWGIKAPITAPTFTTQGSAVSWQKDTFYSPASIFIDPLHGNLWQITTAGKTAGSQPAWSASPTPQQKVVINSVYADGVNIYFQTDTQSPALVAGDTVVLQNMCTFGPNTGGSATTPNLDGLTLTVSATGLTTTAFQAPYTATSFGSSGNRIGEYGQALKTAGTNPPTSLTDGTAVWTCIQLAASLVWAAHTHYNVGDFLVSPSNFIFQLGPKTQPFIYKNQSQIINFQYLTGGASLQSTYKGAFPFWNSADPTPSGPLWNTLSPASQTMNSLNVNGLTSSPWTLQNFAVNGAGELGSPTGISGSGENTAGAFTCFLFVPRPGAYSFTLSADDGCFMGFDSHQVSTLTVAGGAYKVSGAYIPQSGGGVHNLTAALGYGQKPGGTGYANLAGNDNPTSSGPTVTAITWNFPQAGCYGLEIDYANWEHHGQMIFTCPAAANNIANGRDTSGTVAPSWPPFTKSGASFDVTNETIIWGANVVEIQAAGQQYKWNNIGPVSDFIWIADTFYTKPGTEIIDTNGNQELAYESGATGTTAPSSWATSVGGLTADPNPPLTWINGGSVPSSTGPQGNTITALSTQGWLYWIALVNTLDNTVSNVSPVSLPTGPLNKGQVTFPAGSGLDPNTIDPQADYVAIFRSTDGFSTPFLIPGFVNSPYTVPLTQYLRNGYTDTTADSDLNNLLEGAQAGENTPPAIGAQNLTYHLNRIWYSIGNTVYWTTGGLAPVGNGIDGTAPQNFSGCPSRVTCLVPVAIGMLVFTVSDVYIIAGNGTTSSPILPAIPYLTGVGLPVYNALDINGGLIGFFTTDKQFVIFDPSAGLSYVGFNIGDQFRLNNGNPGQSWNPNTVYVAWYINGEDQAWYVADGVNGWYRVMQTPAPEQGSVCWSPFATVVGGAGAIKSVETSPGVHNLLVGQPTAAGKILNRNVDATTDAGSTGSNGSTYGAYGVFGSVVLASPGQIAKIAFIETDSVKVGSPLITGVIINEALPYYKGSFDILKDWVPDPPNLPKSQSFYEQRFYLSENQQDTAYCKHLQILFQWPAENAANELQTFTIFGAFEVEQ
jgi:hypothetical protein